MSTEEVKPEVAKKPKVQITIEKLKELMLGGMNRKAIAEHFGAPVSVVNKFFKHPDLKNLRPKHASEFELVDGEGKSYSPGYLANAAKEAKEAQAEEVVDEATDNEVAEEVLQDEAPTPVVAESTGI